MRNQGFIHKVDIGHEPRAGSISELIGKTGCDVIDLMFVRILRSHYKGSVQLELLFMNGVSWAHVQIAIQYKQDVSTVSILRINSNVN